MKKLILILFLSLFMFNIKAICNDESLSEWATNVQVEFTKDSRTSSDITEGEELYAYFLSISSPRDDIKLIVIDGKGNKAEAKNYDSLNIYGVGCFTDLKEETYTLEVYGNDNSACPNELLKTLKYTVEPYNYFTKTEYCEKYPEHDLCQTYTDKTQNITEEEFKEELKEYDNQIQSQEWSFNRILKTIINYGIYMFTPFVLITIVYIIKSRKIKKEKEKF